MVIRLDSAAQAELARLYYKNPELSKTELQFIEDLLYHLSQGKSVNLTVTSGSLHISKGWEKKYD